jgi:flagellar basal body-associated protein FliL
MRTKRIAARFLTLLALVAPMQAFAAEPAKASAPSAEYERGYAAIEAKNWTKAYEIFSELWAHPKRSDSEFDVAIDLGQAELMLSKYRDAAEHLSIGIQMASPEDADVKERASKGLARAKKKIGTLKISVPDGSEVFINGKPIGTAPIITEVFVEPGSVKVTAKHPSRGEGESQLDVVAGDQKNVEVTLKDGPSNAPLKPPYGPEALDNPAGNLPLRVNPPPSVEKNDGLQTKTIVLVVGGAVTLVAAGTATYFGLKARSAKGDADDLSKQAGTTYGASRCSNVAAVGSSLCADIRSKRDTQADAGKIANISLAVTGVAAVTTGVLYLLWPTDGSKTTQGLTISPVVSHQNAGLWLQGNF